MLLQATEGLQEALSASGSGDLGVLEAVSWALDGLAAVLDGAVRHPDCPAQARVPLSLAAVDITEALVRAGVAWGACGMPGPGPATPAQAESEAWRAATAAQALHRAPPAAALPSVAGALGTLAGCLDGITAALPTRSVEQALLAEATGSLRTAAGLVREGAAVFRPRSHPRGPGPAAAETLAWPLPVSAGRPALTRRGGGPGQDGPHPARGRGGR